MPEYQGEKLKDVDVQSDIFEGIKFSECIYHCMFSSVRQVIQWSRPTPGIGTGIRRRKSFKNCEYIAATSCTSAS